jgi:limonene-1,2-epoxide hydrolase
MTTSISDSGIVVAAARTERAVAVELVREFMDALVRRDLAAASTHLAPGFELLVSGNHRFRTLAEFAAFSRQRNGAIRKSVEAIEACESATGIAVFAHGTMSGEWLDGSAFSGVRFIDRFHVVDGRIASMQVWSDMAEFRPR